MRRHARGLDDGMTGKHSRIPERIEADAARYAFIRRHARAVLGGWLLVLDESAHPGEGARFEAELDAAILSAPHLPPSPKKG